MKNSVIKKILSCIFLFSVCFLVNPVMAQDIDIEPDVLFKATVVDVVDELVQVRENGSLEIRQKLLLRGLEGEWLNQEIIHDGLDLDVISATKYKANDKVIVVKETSLSGEDRFYVVEHVRSGALFWLAILFAIAVVLIGGFKGVRALLVLGLTVLVILKIIIPQILAGTNPVVVAIIGSILILLLAIYVTEGINTGSHLAIISIAVALVITGLLSLWFVDLVNLTGFGDEDVLYLISSAYGNLNVRGLLMAGIIIGTLGVLDDVVISQISVVKQIRESNTDLKNGQVYKKAMKVGVSHLSSMVNTLFLAYAGASLPLLLLFGVNNLAPLGLTQVLSNEMIATEIVRTLVGSIGLVLAVPISTLLAVSFIKRTK